MVLVRLLLFLALTTIGVSLLLYFVRRDRRYLVFVWQVAKFTLLVLALVVVIAFAVAVHRGIASQSDIEYLVNLARRDGLVAVYETIRAELYGVDPALTADPLITDHQGRNRLRRARIFYRETIAYAASLGRPCALTLHAVHGISADFGRSVAEGDLLARAHRALLME